MLPLLLNLCDVGIVQGWPDFFDRGPDLKINFLSWATLFKITDFKVKISAKQKKIGF